MTGDANPELSVAVLAYLHKGRSPFPTEDPAALRQRGEPEEVVGQVQDLIRETLDIKVDWSSTSLAQAYDVVAAAVAARHPELTRPAAEALARLHTYINR